MQQLLRAATALEGPASCARSLPAVSQGFCLPLLASPAPARPPADSVTFAVGPCSWHSALELPCSQQRRCLQQRRPACTGWR